MFELLTVRTLVCVQQNAKLELKMFSSITPHINININMQLHPHSDHNI